jgi:hypothetical protein
VYDVAALSITTVDVVVVLLVLARLFACDDACDGGSLRSVVAALSPSQHLPMLLVPLRLLKGAVTMVRQSFEEASVRTPGQRYLVPSELAVVGSVLMALRRCTVAAVVVLVFADAAMAMDVQWVWIARVRRVRCTVLVCAVMLCAALCSCVLSCCARACWAGVCMLMACSPRVLMLFVAGTAQCVVMTAVLCGGAQILGVLGGASSLWLRLPATVAEFLMFDPPSATTLVLAYLVALLRLFAVTTTVRALLQRAV